MIEALMSLLLALGGNDPGAHRERDKAAILSQCGCFEVTFAYTETEALKPGYPLRPPKQVKGLEWVTVDRASNDAIALQHVLIGSGGRVQKHWRQVWDYQPRMLFEFQGRGRLVTTTAQSTTKTALRSTWDRRAVCCCTTKRRRRDSNPVAS